MHVSLPSAKYKTPEKIEGFYTEALQRISSLPGVVQASIATDIPIRGWTYGESFEVEGRPATSRSSINSAHYQRVSPDYFRTFSIPLVQGRSFTPQDQTASPPVIIINETLARRFFPNEQAVGKRLLVADKAREIVGVAGNVHVYGLGDQVPDENPEIFIPHSQDPFTDSYFAIRTSGDPLHFANAFRGEIRALDRDQPVTKVMTMDQVVSETLSDEKFNTLLIGMFAALAVALAAVGIYGIISYVVAQHTREIGIRVALGAQRSHVLKLIIGQGMFLAVIGIALGLGLSFAVTRVLASLLHGVSATDQLTFMVAPFFLALIAFAACYIPARRATKVDPLVALRSE